MKILIVYPYSLRQPYFTKTGGDLCAAAKFMRLPPFARTFVEFQRQPLFPMTAAEFLRSPLFARTTAEFVMQPLFTRTAQNPVLMSTCDSNIFQFALALFILPRKQEYTCSGLAG